MSPLPMRSVADPRVAAGVILAIAIVTVAAALGFEHIAGLRPCKLCLMQRWPYYVGVPLALGTVIAAGASRFWARAGLAGLALVFFAGTALGAHHAGVEWGWWPGPTDCGGVASPVAGTVGDFLKSLEGARVVSCTEAAWRFLGLSMAGWNTLVSLGLAALALVAALKPTDSPERLRGHAGSRDLSHGPLSVPGRGSLDRVGPVRPDRA